MGDDAVERLRRICLALPETTERISHGAPSFFVQDKKMYATYVGHHHDARLSSTPSDLACSR